MINELKVSKYNSLEEFISFTDACPKYGIDYGSWCGAENYSEAVTIAREGTDLQRAEQTLKQLEHTRPIMQQVMDVTGSVVNMDAYLSGLPENMMEFPIVEEPTKFLNLFVDVSESGFVSSERLVNKAIAVASIVDDLENNGYRVAVTVGMVSSQRKSFNGVLMDDYTSTLVAMVKIKEYHKVLSVGQLIGCCHPSFLRVLMFCYINGTYRNFGGPAKGYGRPTRDQLDLEKALAEVADKDMVYIPSNEDLSSVESAVEMISKYIHKP